MFVFLDADEIEEQAKERLEAVLINRPRIPPVPLAVLITIELGQTSQMLSLARYVADGLIGSYDVFSVSEDIFDITQSVRLGEAVKTVIQKVPADPAKLLTISSLRFNPTWLTGGPVTCWAGQPVSSSPSTTMHWTTS